jgi:hypothetical protein
LKTKKGMNTNKCIYQEAGKSWRKEQTAEVENFLKSAPVTPLRKKIPKQQVIVPLTGLEWEGRKVLYKLVDTVVDMARHRLELKEHLPSRGLDKEDWVEIPIPRTDQEQEYLHRVLDEMDSKTANSETIIAPIKSKPGRGKKKQQLQAGRGDQPITSFFKIGNKAPVLNQTCQDDLACEESPCWGVEGMGKITYSGCGDVDEKLLLDASNASVDEMANMRCEKRNDERVCDETTGVTGNVGESRKEQNNQTHTAGVSFKLLGRVNFFDNFKKGKIKMHNSPQRNNIHSSFKLSLSTSKKRGITDSCIDQKSLPAENNPELIDLDGGTGGDFSAKKKRKLF